MTKKTKKVSGKKGGKKKAPVKEQTYGPETGFNPETDVVTIKPGFDYLPTGPVAREEGGL